MLITVYVLLYHLRRLSSSHPVTITIPFSAIDAWIVRKLLVISLLD